MTDTPPEIKRIVRDKIMARSSEERFVMGSLMFDSAREMIKASLPTRLARARTPMAIVQTYLRRRN